MIYILEVAICDLQNVYHIFVLQTGIVRKKELQALIEEQKILNRIYVIRGEKVMIDRDLAELYGVETKRLKEAVKRNKQRFPRDFMFEMTAAEFKKWRESSALNAADRQGLRHPPFCFTEQGVTMLSCILNSSTAINVNIRVIRVFTRLRETALTHKDILLQLSKLEKEVKGNSQDIGNIFAVLRELIERQKAAPVRNSIGYKRYDEAIS